MLQSNLLHMSSTKGSIVFTSSAAARVPPAWISFHCATKAAIDSYAQTLYGEMEPFGVKVHSVITGGVNTRIGDGDSIDEGEKQFENSLYYVDGCHVSGLAAKDMATHGISPELYAKDLLPRVLNKLTRFNLYGGRWSYALRLMGRFYPLWLLEFLMRLLFKQDRVFRNIKKLRK